MAIVFQQPGQGQAGGGMPPPPKPPRQNPYHDGVASSAQYYDLFEMIRRPNLAKENRPPDPPARSPKPLSKQKQIEKEIEQKFKAKRNRPTHQGKSLSASVIRIIFLALVLPPYIILYRLPKFLLVDWILFIARFVDNTLAAIGKAIQNAYKRLKMRIRNSILSFWELIKVTFRKKMANQVDDDEPLSFIAFIAAGLCRTLPHHSSSRDQNQQKDLELGQNECQSNPRISRTTSSGDSRESETFAHMARAASAIL